MQADIKKLNFYLNTPRGIRIPVTSVKGKCPRPLDDGGNICSYTLLHNIIVCQSLKRKKDYSIRIINKYINI